MSARLSFPDVAETRFQDLSPTCTMVCDVRNLSVFGRNVRDDANLVAVAVSDRFSRTTVTTTSDVSGTNARQYDVHLSERCDVAAVLKRALRPSSSEAQPVDAIDVFASIVRPLLFPLVVEGLWLKRRPSHSGDFAVRVVCAVVFLVLLLGSLDVVVANR